MKLSVLERLVIQNILPQAANFTNLKLMRVAREALSFTDEENKALEFKPAEDGGGNIQWKPDVVAEREIVIGEVVTLMIVEALKKLDEDKQLTNEHFSLYEKFVETGSRHRNS